MLVKFISFFLIMLYIIISSSLWFFLDELKINRNLFHLSIAIYSIFVYIFICSIVSLMIGVQNYDDTYKPDISKMVQIAR